MDLMMPVMNGAEATGRILEDLPEMKVIILTSFGTSADLLRAIANGAKGVHLKESPMEELLETIRTVAAGGEAMPEEVRQMMDENPTAPALTARQTEILRAISNGTTTEGIAHQLNISQSCIKQHLAAIFKKLGATSRSEAVAIAMRKQLLKI